MVRSNRLVACANEQEVASLLSVAPARYEYLGQYMGVAPECRALPVDRQKIFSATVHERMDTNGCRIVWKTGTGSDVLVEDFESLDALQVSKMPFKLSIILLLSVFNCCYAAIGVSQPQVIVDARNLYASFQ